MIAARASRWSDPHRLREQGPPFGPLCPPPAPRLTEAQLFSIWRGRRFPAGALVTRDGVPVHVVFQGRPGRGPGPDFRGAVIAGPSGLTVRGDVELHVRASSFYAHGHDDDVAYDNVILHVVFEDDTCEDTALPGGGSAPVVALAPWVATRAGELQRWLERPLLWREPCGDALARMGDAGVAAALEAEGDRRLAARIDRFARDVAAGGLDQALYERLLEALGYGGNATPMLALAHGLPWRVLKAGAEGATDRHLAFEAALIGAAGLLPSQRDHAALHEPHVEALERAHARAAAPPLLVAAEWKTAGVRPENAPARRLAAAAALLAGVHAPSGLLRSAEATTTRDALGLITGARADTYWARHYDPCGTPCRMPRRLIGRSRALEIVLNVVVPAAIAGGDSVLAANARELYAKLPRPASYGVTRYLEETLASEGRRAAINARRAQGLLALHRDWCTQGGCGRCPLS